MPSVTVTRGCDVEPRCDVAVVVISTNSDPRARQAVVSLLNNDHTAEIIVVNTGKGTLRHALHDLMDSIVLVECPQRQYAGGARNLGIQHSTSPIVSFLASDCLTPRDWIRNRLVAHQSSALVPSNLLPFAPSSRKSTRTVWASYFVTHFERVPGMPSTLAKPFGLSYARHLFSDHGLFDPTLRTGEDSEFNARIPSYATLPSASAVNTFHIYPERLLEAIAVQYRRGIHEYRFAVERYGRSRLAVAGRSAKRVATAFAWIMKSDTEQSREIRRSAHLVALLLAARCLGNLLALR